MDWPLKQEQEAPLPHLSSVAYFRTSEKRSCSPPPRPVPPTPYGMKAHVMDYTHVEDDPARHRKRYSASSAIPRPSSGTSRHATPLGIPLLTVSSDQQTDPSRPRKSFHSSNGKPPSAWVSSKTRLPRSDSLLPYSERPQHDLSGLKQQLHVRHYSTQSLSSPGKIGLPPSTNSIPKSHSSKSLLSPSRDITPRRSLMKPLSPSLPRSHTFSNLSCTSLPAPTPSPLKPAPTRIPRSAGSSRLQVDVVDALRESRMTEDEIMHWKQTQLEVASNQDRLRAAYEIRQHKQLSPPVLVSPTSASFVRSNEEATINLSANDVANTRRLEDQRRKSISGRPLFINSVLANAGISKQNISSPNTIASTASSAPEQEWDTNLRQVTAQTHHTSLIS